MPEKKKNILTCTEHYSKRILLPNYSYLSPRAVSLWAESKWEQEVALLDKKFGQLKPLGKHFKTGETGRVTNGSVLVPSFSLHIR